MTSKDDDGEIRDVPTEAQQLLLNLREANEKLVLAALRAQELSDESEDARRFAEDALQKAEAAIARAERLKAELEQSAHELRVTGEFREKLIAIVGHDLRNPLGAITMAAALLARNINLSPTDAKLTARITSSAVRMTRMITQLLDFTRAGQESGFVLELRPTNLREVTDQVIEELEVGTRAQVHCDFRGELTGVWDQDRLAQVLSNITGNAVDHAAPGTAILITAFEMGDDVLIEVSNQGDPIPAAVLPVLFEPFGSGRANARPKAGHLGLGLYIAFKLVEAHGGGLSARSEGGATTFTIRLPRAGKGQGS